MAARCRTSPARTRALRAVLARVPARRQDGGNVPGDDGTPSASELPPDPVASNETPPDLLNVAPSVSAGASSADVVDDTTLPADDTQKPLPLPPWAPPRPLFPEENTSAVELFHQREARAAALKAKGIRPLDDPDYRELTRRLDWRFDQNRRRNIGLLVPFFGAGEEAVVGARLLPRLLPRIARLFSRAATADTGPEAVGGALGGDRLPAGEAGPPSSAVSLPQDPAACALREAPAAAEVGTPKGYAPLSQLPPSSSGGPTAGMRVRSSQRFEPGTPCIYCSRPTTKEAGPYKLHEEHVIPLSRGGNNELANKATACQTDNLSKGARTKEEYYDYLLRKEDERGSRSRK